MGYTNRQQSDYSIITGEILLYDKSYVLDCCNQKMCTSIFYKEQSFKKNDQSKL